MNSKVKSCLHVISILVTFNLAAQTLDESQALNLGTIAITSNDSVGFIEINKDAFISTSGGVRILIPGTPAIFEARGFDANRRLYITVQANQGGTVTGEVSPEQFVVESYDADEFITTDNSGSADFVVGARFTTSGSGSENFRDTTYTARYTVTVNY